MPPTSPWTVLPRQLPSTSSTPPPPLLRLLLLPLAVLCLALGAAECELYGAVSIHKIIVGGKHRGPLTAAHSPSSLRSQGLSYVFGAGGGMVTYSWPSNGRPSTRADRLTLGFSTLAPSAAILRVDSQDGLGDFLELYIEDGRIAVIFNVGTGDVVLREERAPVNDGRYHLVKFMRSGANATLQLDHYPPNEHYPSLRQLTIFNSQAWIRIGGRDRPHPFQGLLSGLYYNGLKVLNLAAASDAHTRTEGALRVVRGMSPHLATLIATATATATAEPTGPAAAAGPRTSTATLVETTTTITVTTTTEQGRKAASAEEEEDEEGEDEEGEAALAPSGPHVPVRPPVQQDTLMVITDDVVVSSAECPSDDEDLEECQPSSGKTMSLATYEGSYRTHVPRWDGGGRQGGGGGGDAGRGGGGGGGRGGGDGDPQRSTGAPVSSTAGHGAPTLTPVALRPHVGNMNTHEVKPHEVKHPQQQQPPHGAAEDGEEGRGYGELNATFPTVRRAGVEAEDPMGIPGVAEAVPESGSTTGMVAGIVAAAALCILILLYAMYKYQSRDGTPGGTASGGGARDGAATATAGGGSPAKGAKTSPAHTGASSPCGKDKEYFV
ncbi:unnamed protein product [Lampetra fluviatilis]